MSSIWTKRAAVVVASMTLVAAVRAADAPPGGDIGAEIMALKARIADLEAKEGENWMTKEREAQIRKIVDDVVKDAKTRDTGTLQAGYNAKDSFFIQNADQSFKLSVGGFVQVRWESAFSNATDGRRFPSRSLTPVNNTTGIPTTASVISPDPGNSAGIDIRRARVSFAGNVLTPDLTFKMEGDFYGASTGSFTVTDAWAAYKFSDLFKVKAGSFKVPFAKAELTSDTNLQFMERPEVLSPFDPVRALGVSLYGDFIKDQLAYEINVDDGGNSNTLRRDDTVGLTANLDNRMAYYARVQWAGAGKISDFAEEADLRADNRDFIWMLGGAVGYESQNATNYAFPSPQTSTTVGGLSSSGNGFASTYNLNGDLYRATLDWSAKCQGLSINTAAYIQQVNANPGNTSSTSGTAIATGPFGAGKSSFFEWGGYGQVGYFVVPQTVELVTRAGLLATEGYTNIGEYYTVGANYYVFKNQNFKISADVTYTPEAAYTDAATSLLQNTHDIAFRVQMQVKF
jgi:hypothetical protein